jgi:hypothetical protein
MAISSSSWPGERLLLTRRVDEAPGVCCESFRPANDRTSLLAVDIMALTAKTKIKYKRKCKARREMFERQLKHRVIVITKHFLCCRAESKIYYCSMDVISQSFHRQLEGFVGFVLSWCSRWTTKNYINDFEIKKNGGGEKAIHIKGGGEQWWKGGTTAENSTESSIDWTW